MPTVHRGGRTAWSPHSMRAIHVAGLLRIRRPTGTYRARLSAELRQPGARIQASGQDHRIHRVDQTVGGGKIALQDACPADDQQPIAAPDGEYIP